MDKKTAFILIALLCAILYLSFALLSKKTQNANNPQPTNPATTDSSLPEKELEKAFSLLRNKNYSSAVAEFERVARTNPKSAIADDALYEAGQLYFYELNDKVKAKLLFQELLTQYPDSKLIAKAHEKINLCQ